MADTNNGAHKLWKIAEKVIYYGALIVLGVFYLGGTRQKVQQKVTTLETEMAAIQTERKEEKKHITDMDLQGSVATKNFIANYEKKQKEQDQTIKEIQSEVKHLELMKSQIDRLERKIGDPKP